MKELKLVSVVGARPQIIKYFAVSTAIKKRNKRTVPLIKDILMHTGQHYDYNMSKIFFKEFSLKEPEYNLGVGSFSHGRQTGEMLEKIEKVIAQEKPDIVLVYGDTNSTLAGALAAAKLHIPVAHVEAGLRSYNKNMPEEINRVLTDHISTFLFCPTDTSVRNLKKEGFTNILNFNISKVKADNDTPAVVKVGDVMHDVVIYASNILPREHEKQHILLTLHRAENTDNPVRLKEIISFINEISAGKKIIFPVHPRTNKALRSVRIKLGSNIRMIEPVSYFEMLKLLADSSLVMTDSGGLQKEAYWLRVPCVTLRDETEWMETIRSGWNVLYRNYKGNHKILNKRKLYNKGKTAKNIIDILLKWRKI